MSLHISVDTCIYIHRKALVCMLRSEVNFTHASLTIFSSQLNRNFMCMSLGLYHIVLKNIHFIFIMYMCMGVFLYVYHSHIHTVFQARTLELE